MNTNREQIVADSTRRLAPSGPHSAPEASPDAFRPPSRAAGTPWTELVCLVFVAVQLALVVPGSKLGWDETVYTSQVSGQIPAAFFSAPRARGVSFLAAPVAEFTTSTPALRVYLAVLSGVGLYLALRVWRDLLPTRVRALAGGLFAGLWITVFYGPQVMPNMWSALAALAAVGCFLRAWQDRTDRAALIGLAVAVAVAGLMRPPDAAWLVLPLAVAAVAVRGRRAPLLCAALAAGLLLGCAEWVIEAYVRYGGVPERLHRSSAIEGGIGLHLAVDDQLRSLNGLSLCRPCDRPWHHRATSVWFLALPVLVAGGAAVVPRARRAASWLALLTGLSMAVPYLFTISYAAPRFLLPAYALLAIPVAELLWWPATRADGRLRPVVTAVIAAALAVHLAIQGAVLSTATGNNRRAGRAYATLAAGLHAGGVRPPCVLSGESAVPLAYYAGCASRQLRGPDESTTLTGLRTAARDRPVAVLVGLGGHRPAFTAGWRPLALPGPTGPADPSTLRAYLAPRRP